MNQIIFFKKRQEIEKFNNLEYTFLFHDLYIYIQQGAYTANNFVTSFQRLLYHKIIKRAKIEKHKVNLRSIVFETSVLYIR